MPRPPDPRDSRPALRGLSPEVLVAGAFAVGTLGYLWCFHTYGKQRPAMLSFLLLPDELIAEVVASWYGWNVTRFGILDRWPVLFAAAVILGVAYLAGGLALDWLRLEGLLTKLERSVLAIGIGLNCVSLYTLMVGLAGGLQSRLAFLIPAIACGLICFQQWRLARSAAPRPRLEDGSPRQPVLVRICCWLGLPFVVAILAGGVLPPWHFDVREYHLQVPKEWYQQGGIDFMPHNIYGNMPLGVELHAIVGTNMMWG